MELNLMPFESENPFLHTRLGELKIVAFRIKNQLQFYLAVSRLVTAVPPNHLLHILTILV